MDRKSGPDFYRNVVGLEEAWRRENICAGFVNNGNTHHDIGMVDIINPQFHDHDPDLFHVAFELETQVDLKEGYDRAVAEDMVFLPFAYVEAAANILTNPAVDPYGKIPEFKFSAVKVEKANVDQVAAE